MQLQEVDNLKQLVSASEACDDERHESDEGAAEVERLGGGLLQQLVLSFLHLVLYGLFELLLML